MQGFFATEAIFTAKTISSPYLSHPIHLLLWTARGCRRHILARASTGVLRNPPSGLCTVDTQLSTIDQHASLYQQADHFPINWLCIIVLFPGRISHVNSLYRWWHHRKGNIRSILLIHSMDEFRKFHEWLSHCSAMEHYDHNFFLREYIGLYDQPYFDGLFNPLQCSRDYHNVDNEQNRWQMASQPTFVPSTNIPKIDAPTTGIFTRYFTVSWPKPAPPFWLDKRIWSAYVGPLQLGHQLP